ncbi:MAG: hypothetical protein AB1896_15540 [Thermodesulfobacteriota bacterium]
MGFFYRFAVGTCGLLAVLLLWWFPEPALFRVERVDWAARYEAAYTPPAQRWGVMEEARALIRASTPFQSLPEFIANETRGRLFQAQGETWGRLFDSYSWDRPRYHRPGEAPFAALTQDSGYVERRDVRGGRHWEYRKILPSDYQGPAIPAETRYPFRKRWPFLLAGLAAVWVWAGLSRAAGPVETSSPARGAKISTLFLASGAGLMLWPFLYGTIGSGASFASVMIGGLVAISGGVGLWLFLLQVSLIRRMIEGGDHLAHFTYSPEEWRRFAEWDYAAEAAEKKSLWRLVFVISLVIGLGFIAVMRDRASVWVFAGLMGFNAFLYMIAVGLPRLTLRRNLGRTGEVYLGSAGVYLNGSVHAWNYWGARFEAAELLTEPLPHILLTYSQLQAAGKSLRFYRRPIVVRVPVPRGREEVTRQLVERLIKIQGR